MMPLFSIIIPVYKVEDYLHKCVNSVLDQNFEDIEVLLVDDGSPDNCPSICDEFAQQDSRVTVIHKKNGGLSEARNFGVKEAKGEYILFLDSDDYWEDRFHLRCIADIIKEKKGIDTILFRCKSFFQDSNTFDDRNSKPESTNNLSNNNQKLLKMMCLGSQSSSACLRVVKRSLIIENEIFFKKDLIGEDSDWFINLSLHLKSMYEYPKTFYIYRKGREGSITSNITTKTFEDQLYIIDKWYKYLSVGNYDNDLKKALYGFLSYLYCVLILSLSKLALNDYNFFFTELQKRSFLLKYSINKKSKVIAIVNKIFGFKNTIGIVNKMYYYMDKYRKL